MRSCQVSEVSRGREARIVMIEVEEPTHIVDPVEGKERTAVHINDDDDDECIRTNQS